MSLAFFSFLLVLSVMKGLKESSVSRYLKAEPHLEVIVPSPKDKRIASLEKSLNNQNVKRHYIFESQDLILKNSEGLLSGVKAIGLKKKNLIRFFNKPENKKLAQDLLKKEVLIGADIAYTHNFLEGESLTAFPLEAALYPVGEVPLSESVSIKGLFSLDVPEIDGSTIFYVINDTFSDFRNSKQKTIGVHVKLKNPYKYKVLENDIKALGFQVSSWKDRNSDFFFSLQLEKLVMALFLVLTGLLASFSVSTVLSLLIEQKQQEISTLMSIGLCLNSVKKLFRQISFLLSFLGLAIGLGLSILVCLYLEAYPLYLLPSHVFYDSSLPVHLTLDTFLFVFTVGIFIVFLNSRLAVLGFKPLLRRNSS